MKHYMHQNNVLLIAGVLVLIGLALFAYYKYTTMSPFVDNKEYGNKKAVSGQSVDVYYFYVNWCPHCKKAEPIWDEVSDEYNGKVISGYKLNFIKVDCTNDDDPDVKNTLSQFNI